ncbi:alpha/beta-hydrolase [Aspergillus heteromorphus CBS 117.55]|uniref:Alpha/beta-hydrolase n=1 Tax=Aspergillus heteromorphus CBS 117.55 TaxID=1448321 RepID=A0A317WU34_9EURO|nr:alpha/beta-hydrolase [Aspergillus heteromorphus CBS 117.55]PWY89866.1 alpha/beta-hydrolase [Aspergillus heteromorphus CBS 117.55]
MKEELPPPTAQPSSRRTSKFSLIVALVLIYGVGLSKHHDLHHPYGLFPQPDDPFRFLPCTRATVPPALDDPDAAATWASRFDPDHENWNWGGPNGDGIFLCGYLDVPLDYTNQSDPRIARLAVTKFQVSGPHGGKSERTLVVNPGGPGGSGTGLVWRATDEFSQRFTNGQYDVLGWDPRGVNTSLPRAACFPFDANRDRWALLRGQYREVAGPGHLELADALNEAIFQACYEQLGDLGRFLSTTFVARDVEEIRKALGEKDLTGYFVSYGTGIGQTWANMFPSSVGRLILDGTEYVRDHRKVGGFGYTALDNATDAWHDGFLGECLHAGPEHCALASPKNGTAGPVRLADLDARMHDLVSSLIHRPIPGYTPSSGPSIITYSALVSSIYGAMYNAVSWPALAQMLSELEDGNTTLAAHFIEAWEYDPRDPASCPSSSSSSRSSPSLSPSTDELTYLVICADSADSPEWLTPDGPQELSWWTSLWESMTNQAWISGNSRFYNVFPCRQFNRFWGQPAELYRGDLNQSLANPILLIAETYDPATPLRNGRRLLTEMGHANARLVVHHGYGHSSRDGSACTDGIARGYLLTGQVPEEGETDCFADERPYLYGVKKRDDPVALWKAHLETLTAFGGRRFGF